MAYAASAGRHRYVFDDLRALLARASPDRSGDRLAGLAADTEGGARRGPHGLGRRSLKPLPR